MKIKRFNESAFQCKATSLTGEVTLYRLTSHSVVDLKETGNYYVVSKSDIDSNLLGKKGKDLYLITVKSDSSNIDLDKSEMECVKLGSKGIVYIKDDKKCELVSVEPYKKNK